VGFFIFSPTPSRPRQIWKKYKIGWLLPFLFVMKVAYTDVGVVE
jgi:hypothetical protein